MEDPSASASSQVFRHILSLAYGDPDNHESTNCRVNCRPSATKTVVQSRTHICRRLFLLSRDLNEDAAAAEGGAGCSTKMPVATARGIAVLFGSAAARSCSDVAYFACCLASCVEMLSLHWHGQTSSAYSDSLAATVCARSHQCYIEARTGPQLWLKPTG